MNWIDHAITEFGRNIGIPSLQLNSSLRLKLKLENDSCINIQHMPELALPEVIISRAELLNYLNEKQFRAALKLANFRKQAIWPVQVACNEKELLIAMRIPERSFSLNVLEQTIEQLTLLHKKIKNF